MSIYILNGLSNQGKSTFAKRVCELTTSEAGVELSTVDGIKAAARCIGWSGTKSLDDRNFLYELKCLARDYYDFPVRDAIERTEEFLTWAESNGFNRKECAVFINTRDPEEIARFKEHWGDECKAVLVRRSQPTEELSEADAEVYNCKYDIIIENTGTLVDLAYAAIKFVDTEDLYTPSATCNLNEFGEFDYNA